MNFRLDIQTNTTDQKGILIFFTSLAKITNKVDKFCAIFLRIKYSLKIIAIKEYKNKRSAPRHLEKELEIFDWFLVLQNDFGNQNFAIFDGSVKNFGTVCIKKVKESKFYFSLDAQPKIQILNLL